MAFFHPRAFTVADAGFQPLFRLLSDLENFSQEGQSQGQGRCGGNNGRAAQRHCRQQRQHVRTFHPRFDVRETETAYELHGELPGVDRENLQIEFTEPQTIAIRGRVERIYNAGPSPAAADAIDEQNDNNADAAAATEKDLLSGDDTESFVTVAADDASTVNHKTTVTDEETEAAKEQGTPTPEPEAAKPATEHQQPKQEQPQKPSDKYWVSERSIGEFNRTFSFPGRVEQEAVSANLKDGILSVVVPKAKKHEARRIDIA